MSWLWTGRDVAAGAGCWSVDPIWLDGMLVMKFKSEGAALFLDDLVKCQQSSMPKEDGNPG